jgi:hypothetical protein
MDALIDGSDARQTPTWRFWVWTLCSPIAAAAAAISGAMLADAPGAYVGLALLAVIYAAALAHEPAIRIMPAARRTAWVLTGLTISAVAVIASFYAFLLILLSTMDWG